MLHQSDMEMLLLLILFHHLKNTHCFVQDLPQSIYILKIRKQRETEKYKTSLPKQYLVTNYH
jgi:hypothetical protein